MTWFKNLRTVTKLMLAFSTMAAVLAVVGYQGLSAANRINDLNDTLYVRHMLGLSAMKDAMIARVMIGRDTRTAILAKDRAEAQKSVEKVEEDINKVRESLLAAEKTLVTEEGKAKIAQTKERFSTYVDATRETARLAVAGDREGALTALDKSRAIGEQVTTQLDGLTEMKERLGKAAAEECDAIYRSARAQLLSMVVGAVVLFFGFGYFIASLVSRPLAAAVSVLDRVASGDMTARLDVNTKDEIGKMASSLNEATESMRMALTEVKRSADSMASASSQLASSSEELASGAQEQASSLQETTATLEELTSTVKQNADNAKQANQVAAASRDTAEKGGQVVTQAVESMAEINAASRSIVDIITTIDEIAFQTNLLALNAAVEAARAGEQGRGFAVVATEVRNLAQRSATSAKEIKALIQDSVNKVEKGSALVNKSGEMLNEIVGSVKKVTDIVAEIAAASREQSVGIDQVSKAMLQMDQVTQTNSAQTEELSSTAQSLSSNAHELQSLVDRFTVDTTATRRATQTAATTHAAKAVPQAHSSSKAKAFAAAAGASASSPSVKSSGESSDMNAFQEF